MSLVQDCLLHDLPHIVCASCSTSRAQLAQRPQQVATFS